MLKLVQKKLNHWSKRNISALGNLHFTFFQINTLIFLSEPSSRLIQHFEKTCIFYDWNENDKISQKTLR